MASFKVLPTVLEGLRKTPKLWGRLFGLRPGIWLRNIPKTK